MPLAEVDEDRRELFEVVYDAHRVVHDGHEHLRQPGVQGDKQTVKTKNGSSSSNNIIAGDNTTTSAKLAAARVLNKP